MNNFRNIFNVNMLLWGMIRTIKRWIFYRKISVRYWLFRRPIGKKFDLENNLDQMFKTALRSRLILVQLRLRGALCDDGGSSSGSDLKSRKSRHIFFPHVYFWLLKVLKVEFLINLKRAFAHDKTELPNNYDKSLYLSSPEPVPFFNENYGSGSATLPRTFT